MSKRQQSLEHSGDEEEESRKQPFQAPAMLLTIGGYLDRFNVLRKELNNKEGQKSNIDTFQIQEAD
jgi:hypothetical protein